MADTWAIITGTAPTGPAGGDLSGTYPDPTVPGLALVVHLAGTETITGQKNFTVSPTVPDPTNLTDAANKEWVLAQIVSGADPGIFAATCAVGINVGDLVYLTGVAGPEVALCDPTDITKMPCCGAVIAKPSGTTATVRRVGQAAVWAGLTTGKVCWVGLTGAPALAPPAGAPGSMRVAQSIGVALNATTIQLNIGESVVNFQR